MTDEERIAVFRNEIAMIGNDGMVEFAKACIKRFPNYIFTSAPSSSTGKHHPADEFNGHGTILHTKRVVKLIPEIAKGMGIEADVDAMIVAGICHDAFKYGATKAPHTRVDHPAIAADMVADVYKGAFAGADVGPKREQALITWECVLRHMGPWSKGRAAKPIQEFTRHELCVHTADLIASREWVKVSI